MTKFTLDDVLLVPQYSEVQSRSDVNLTMQLGRGITLKVPIISSPMDTVTDGQMAADIGNLGGLGIIHRYNTIAEQCKEVAFAREHGIQNVGAAIGATGDYFDRAFALFKAGANVICIDVAHGHHINVKRALLSLRAAYPNLHIMAGNVATGKAFADLQEWGADSIRCGVGGGSACSTRIQTGHGVTNLQTLQEVYKVATTAKVIIDGGIKSAGDMVKAFVFGADAVMVGSMLAGTDSSPGKVVGGRKVYRGMASKEAQIDWRGKAAAAEGVVGGRGWSVGCVLLGEAAGCGVLRISLQRLFGEVEKDSEVKVLEPA